MFSANSSQVSDDKLFVEDVFSTYLYTGTGAAQTITNGIDLAGKGGLVWVKSRSAATNNFLFDTARGVNVEINSNTADANATLANSVTAFNSNGFAISSAAGIGVNAATYASWTFREAPKFFDVVTYTGNGVSTGRNISHNLGARPGFIIVKRTDSTSNWAVLATDPITGFYHGGVTSTPFALNLTNAKTWSGGGSAATATTFNACHVQLDDTTNLSADFNVNGATYVAYLYANNAGGFGLSGTDSVVSCGSFTTDPSTYGFNVTLGWEPQWVMIKRTDSTGNWMLYDNMRGMPVGPSGYGIELYPNTAGAEALGFLVAPNATGFSSPYYVAPSANFIYIAIRRGPMRTPTLGTSVFKPVTYTGDGTTPRNLTGAGFPPDYAIQSDRGSGNGRAVYDKLRGTGKKLITNTTAAESSVAGGYAGTMLQDGIVLDNNYDNYNLNGGSYVTHLFRRAPGFFDEVCYTGTGSAGTITHNLGVVPELVITKGRGSVTNWGVYTAALGPTKALLLNGTNSEITSANYWNNTAPTATQVSLGATTNSSTTFVAYLFASAPGVSKVGSYTGNGSSQTINCGFAAGARFVLIKRTDSTGDWYVWDSARGIVAGNDPHLSLNTTAAEVTSNDTIDTDSSGFVVNQDAATNVNVNAATYIYLAIA